MTSADADLTDLAVLDARTAKPRIAIASLAGLILLCTFFAVRWQIGNMLAVLTPAADPFAGAVAKLATRWAPGDPAGFALAASSADPAAAVAAMEEAVRRAPNEFRWRIDLARAYEQDERFIEAEREFRKGIELAPSFAQPRWALGNFLLRSGRANEALAELRTAAERSETYRDEVFSLVWDYSGRDPARLEEVASGSPRLTARLAYFFAARGRAEEALRSWNQVPNDFRNPEIARSIALGLFEKQHFRESLTFAKDYGAEMTSVPGAVTNASFEDPLLTEDTLFGWRIMRSDARFDAAPDNRVKKDGNRSLRATFKGALKAGFANIFQTVVVEPGGRYRIAASVRTENLRSPGLPVLEVINPSDGSRLGASKAFPAGNSDWGEVTADFTVPARATAVTIRTVRVDCGEDCPITGIFWYDNYRLEKL